MSKAVAEIAIGAGLIALDIFAPEIGIPATIAQIVGTAGAGLVLSGIGTLLNKQHAGLAASVFNPVSPWNVVYGRAKIGGTVVFLEETGPNDQWLHLVYVLACHPCQSVDALIFDGKRVCLDTSGNSISFGGSTSVLASQQTVNIATISRSNNVVIVTTQTPIGLPASTAAGPALMDGDTLQIQNVTTDATLNGLFQIQFLSNSSFTYTCGGTSISITNQGQVMTSWPDYGDTVHMEVALGAQTFAAPPFPGLLASGDTGSQGLWTAHHLLQGRTAVYLRLKGGTAAGHTYDSGLPSIAFQLHGKNDIYDPRSSPPSNAYTENTALCIADFLTHQIWGFKCNYGTDVPTAALIAAANICDESVALANGSTEPRYACNGSFQLTAKRGEILQNLLTACAGRLTYSGGQYMIWPAAWPGSSLSLDMSHLAGPIQWKAKVAIRDLYNGVKATYVSPLNNWQATDMPPYAQDADHGYGSDANLAADGGERRWLDLQMPFTISAATAQRLSKIELLRRRSQGTATLVSNLAAYQLTALDVLSCTIPPLSWSSKLLEITAFRFMANKTEGGTTLGTEIDLQETASAIYSWSTSEELTPEGYGQPVNVGLPGPFVQYLLREGSGLTAHDTSGNGFDGWLFEVKIDAVSPGVHTSVVPWTDNVSWVSSGVFFPAVTGGSPAIGNKTAYFIGLPDATLANDSTSITDFTVEAWCLLPAVNPGWPIFCQLGANSGISFGMQYDSGLAAWLVQGYYYDGASNSVNYTPTGSVFVWRQYIFRRAGGTASVFVDGVFGASHNQTFAPSPLDLEDFTTANAKTINTTNQGGPWTLGELRIWRIALTDAQIAQQFSNRRTVYGV